MRYNKSPIYVTRPLLPPLDEYTELLQDIWQSKWLTNNGHQHQLFESALTDYLGVEYLSLFCNGTVALEIGLQALDVAGREVITTPFSFPATTHAIRRAGATPVFCDIQPDTGNLDPDRIAEAVSDRTACILPVHVYGNPCNTQAIQAVADQHGLKVFYDAAHAFAVRRHDRSILHEGDMSMLSFHATKVFNTVEGGALTVRDATLKQRIDRLKNFGYADEESVVEIGGNGKMNELQAAFGRLQLRYIDHEIAARGRVADFYRQHLSEIPGLTMLTTPAGTTANHAYFPILIDGEKLGRNRDRVYRDLQARGVVARRYFYPLISRFPMYRELPSAAHSRLPVASRFADQVLCLPIHGDLTESDLAMITELTARGRGAEGED